LRKTVIYLQIICIGASSAALAADPARPRSFLDPEPEATDTRYQVFSSTGASTRRNFDQYLEGTAAVTGTLEDSGLRARVGLGIGRFDYPADPPEVDIPGTVLSVPLPGAPGKIKGLERGVSFLGGYELVRKRWSLGAFVGAEALRVSLSQPDPLNPVRGTRWGAKAAVEFDALPTDKTMFSAAASYSMAFRTFIADVRPGYKIIDRLPLAGLSIGDVYIGPHGAFYSDLRDQIWKVGAHLTAAEVGRFRTSIAVGYARDRANGVGAYGLLETSFHF
jgi:hypothetical protein